jgi:hypothetical protein
LGHQEQKHCLFLVQKILELLLLCLLELLLLLFLLELVLLCLLELLVLLCLLELLVLLLLLEVQVMVEDLLLKCCPHHFALYSINIQIK